ncbi:DUF1731 domain-containing protein [Nocardia sp. NBC_00565]|uniref:DUF1731 domain-containing protein n=1 Tax=Nocardia sp. NBC_00565 TaxID=2975993 RepID=UPI002E81E38C|nr:DUF1731 domain-containing protein [Nocardia sp. NBC_00565]
MAVHRPPSNSDSTRLDRSGAPGGSRAASTDRAADQQRPIRSDPALGRTGRRATSTVLGEAGFTFRYPALDDALTDLLPHRPEAPRPRSAHQPRCHFRGAPQGGFHHAQSPPGRVHARTGSGRRG